MATKTTAQLEPGDQVILPGGLQRTVARVVPTGYRGIVGNRPLFNVYYAEGRTPEWSEANAANDRSVWTLA